MITVVGLETENWVAIKVLSNYLWPTNTNLVPFLTITASCSSSFSFLHCASSRKSRQSFCQRSGLSHGNGTVASSIVTVPRTVHQSTQKSVLVYLFLQMGTGTKKQTNCDKWYAVTLSRKGYYVFH